jgi:uncharacterized Zn finger protein
MIIICKDCRGVMEFVQISKNAYNKDMWLFRCINCGRVVEELPELSQDQKYK